MPCIVTTFSTFCELSGRAPSCPIYDALHQAESQGLLKHILSAPRQVAPMLPMPTPAPPAGLGVFREPQPGATNLGQGIAPPRWISLPIS